MSNHLLIIGTGQTDVQLVSNGARWKFRDDSCHDLHEELERREHEWSFVDDVTGVPDDVKAVPKAEERITSLPEGRFTLCTPKLDAILRYFPIHDLPSHVLVLDTRRQRKSDPVFSGRAIQRRIRERLGDGATVECCTYLKDREILEDPREPRDALVRREVARRIEEGVVDMLRRARPDAVTLALTGGLPILDLVVEEMVRLQVLAHGRACARPAEIPVTVLKVPESTKPTEPDVAVPDTAVRPHMSSAVRRRAVELLAEGHALGAWGVAKVFDGHPDEQAWVDVFRWVYRWVTSLPIEDPHCDIEIINNPQRAVRAAVSVELALLAGNVPAATLGTVAFFEAVLWDHLCRDWLECDPANSRIFVLKRDLPADPRLVRSNSGTECKDDRNRPFERLEGRGACIRGDRVKIHDMGGGVDALVSVLVGRPALATLWDAVSGMRTFRNDVAHNVPTPQKMAEVLGTMRKRGLWSAATPPRFLGQSLVVNALSELDIADPSALLDTLLREVTVRTVPAWRTDGPHVG